LEKMRRSAAHIPFMTTLNADQKRNRDTGTPGNGGRFAPDARAESSVELANRLPSKMQRWEAIGEAAVSAGAHIPTDWVFSRVGQPGGKKAVTDAFESAAIEMRAALRLRGLTISDLGYHDAVAYDDIQSISNGVDPRGGTFKDQAIGASARFSRSLLDRGSRRPRQGVRDTDNSALVKGDVIIGDGFARLEVLDVRVDGAYIEVETAFGPIYLDAEGSQATAYDSDDDE
jgi:hypothetical protein